MEHSQIPALTNRIRLERVMERLEQLAQIGSPARCAEQAGKPACGVTRLAFTEQDRLARRLVARWMDEAGLDVRISPIGNISGALERRDAETPVVMTGSHIDTVANGGKFDGALGVVAAIEVAHVFNEAGLVLSHPLEVVCFVMEESSRFKCYGFGSKIMAGLPIEPAALLAQDGEGQTLAEAICCMRSQEDGWPGDDLESGDPVEMVMACIHESRYPTGQISAFVELHVEQGSVLHALGRPIGAVTAIAAPTRLGVTLVGTQSHSGTTPMNRRRDPVVASAEVVLAVERVCKSLEGVVGTVGVIGVDPNLINVIPGQVRIGVDVRSGSLEVKSAAVNAIREEIKRIASRRKISTTIDVMADDVPQPLSEKIIGLIEEQCAVLGIESHRMASKAGHDAAQVARVAEDTGMIFVPSRDGVSHSPQEWTDEQDVLRGAQVLMLTLLRLVE
jgi:hydantoinase/carbamoylase family amidase